MEKAMINLDHKKDEKSIPKLFLFPKVFFKLCYMR